MPAAYRAVHHQPGAYEHHIHVAREPCSDHEEEVAEAAGVLLGIARLRIDERQSRRPLATKLLSSQACAASTPSRPLCTKPADGTYGIYTPAQDGPLERGEAAYMVRSFVALLTVSAFALVQGLAPINCSTAVRRVVDTVPYRSPQAVHTALATRFLHRDVAEIGTRTGDGMECFARSARRAVAIELAAPYCRKLERRSRLLEATGANFSIVCGDYRRVGEQIDADYITWWQQEPHLVNGAVLDNLRALQAHGLIRQSAEAAIVFDGSYESDMRSLGEMRARGWVAWSETVEFDERTLCCAKHRWRGGCSSHCRRASGVFHVAGVPLVAPAAPRSSQSGRLALLGSEQSTVSGQP